MAARAKKSRLGDARLQLGLSQAEVGERLGVTGAAIGHYETGVSRPSADRAAQLSNTTLALQGYAWAPISQVCR